MSSLYGYTGTMRREVMRQEAQEAEARLAREYMTMYPPGTVTLAGNVNLASLHSLIEESAGLHVLSEEYQVHGLEVPEDVTKKINALAGRIKAAAAAERQQRISRLEAEIKELRTKEEKRADKEAELARLQAGE